MATDRIYPHVYGYIDDTGPTAYDQTGTKNAQLVSSGSFEQRAYYSFDTAYIDDSATIDSVVLYLYCRGINEDVAITVSDYILRVQGEHDRIGAAVTVDDWGLATWYGYKSFGATPPVVPSTFEVNIGVPAINKAGDTDLEVWDISAWTGGPDGPEWEFHAHWGGAPLDCYIDVTYTVPAAGGWFNRWNWKLPALPGFSNVIAAVMLASGDLQVIARFPAQARSAEA